MEKLTLDTAQEILQKHTTEEHLFTHAAAVSAAMGAMARHFGEDEEHWRAVGYLHDVDYEAYPDEHCHHVREFLEPEGVPEADILAIISHGYGITTEEREPLTPLEKSLFWHHPGICADAPRKDGRHGSQEPQEEIQG